MSCANCAGRITTALNRLDGVSATVNFALEQAAIELSQDAQLPLVLGSGAQLLFHAQAVGVAMKGPGEIAALLVETKSGRYAVQGRLFIDCSGDGDVAARAGANYTVGDNGETQYGSAMFRLGGVDPRERADAVR